MGTDISRPCCPAIARRNEHRLTRRTRFDIGFRTCVFPGRRGGTSTCAARRPPSVADPRRAFPHRTPASAAVSPCLLDGGSDECTGTRGTPCPLHRPARPAAARRAGPRVLPRYGHTLGDLRHEALRGAAEFGPPDGGLVLLLADDAPVAGGRVPPLRRADRRAEADLDALGAPAPRLRPEALNTVIENGTYAEVLARWNLTSEAVPTSEINPPGLPRTAAS